jgi:hypothetical protein
MTLKAILQQQTILQKQKTRQTFHFDKTKVVLQ